MAGTIARLVDGYLAAEHWLHCLYLGRVPKPVLARLDPRLRPGLALARRGLAPAAYLRQDLTLWSGRCGAETVKILTWGKPGHPDMFFDIVVDGRPTVEWRRPCWLPSILAGGANLAQGADLFIIETTPALAPAFRRRGCFIVPGALRFLGAPVELLEAQANAEESLRSDLRRVRRAGYRVVTWPYTPERSRRFYADYVVPYARARFGQRAGVPTMAWIDRLFAVGFGVAVMAPDRDEPEVISIAVHYGRALWLVQLGARDGETAILRSGGLAALYEFTIRFAHERGFSLIDMGRSRPWLADGAARYKWKWGFRPAVDPAQTLEYAVKIVRGGSPAVSRLAAHRVMVRTEDRLVAMASDQARPR